MNEDSRELRALRAMAWERAKGELNSIRHTYYSDTNNNYERFKLKLEDFIEYIEANALQE